MNGVDYTKSLEVNSNNLNDVIDYTQITELSLDEVNKNISYNDLKSEIKQVDYQNINNIELTIPSIIENENSYDLNYVKNIGDFSKIEAGATPIEILVASEPDFMPNMYNIYFILTNNDVTDIDLSNNIITEAYDTGRNILSTPYLQKWSMIGVRVDGIDVPQKKQTVSTIKYAGNTINKIVGRYEIATKLELSIRLDQNMYVLDAFHALSGDFWAAERKRKNLIENSPVKILDGKNLFNFLGVAMRPKNGKALLLDVVVEYDADYFSFSRYHDLMGTAGLNGGNVAKSEYAKYDNAKDRVQRFIFHDCKFLGRSSSISFQNTDANPITATFPFVFRKIAHITADGKYN